jgi:uncharacterized membrane protein HdeD (DUF308 family)
MTARPLQYKSIVLGRTLQLWLQVGSTGIVSACTEIGAMLEPSSSRAKSINFIGSFLVLRGAASLANVHRSAFPLRNRKSAR